MRHFLNDTNLSWQAKGMLAFLLEDVDMYTSIAGSELHKKSLGSRDPCFKILDELYKAHYLYKKKAQDENGKIIGNHFFIFEIPYNFEDLCTLSI